MVEGFATFLKSSAVYLLLSHACLIFQNVSKVLFTYIIIYDYCHGIIVVIISDTENDRRKEYLQGQQHGAGKEATRPGGCVGEHEEDVR